MSQPAVNINELDGALGVLPPSSGKLFAVVGPAAAGPIDTPSTFARVKDVVALYIRGPVVEAACYYIKTFGRPVVITRTAASTLGSYLDAVEAADGEVNDFDESHITGTSNGSVAADPEPDGAYSVQILFMIGGTRGTAGIVYQVSLDGGNTFGFATALGTADHITLDIGVTINLSAGTIIAGDYITFTTTAPIPESAGELVVDFDGSSVPTIDDTTHPDDDFEVYVVFTRGGTRGTSGITYKWSLDGGRTLSPETALGTATSIVIPESGGVKVDLGAGTIVAGDTFAFPTVAPRWSNEELDSALTALVNSQVSWGCVEVVGPIDPDAFDVIELAISNAFSRGKYRDWEGSTRMPVGDETAADYRTSLSTAFAQKATVFGTLWAGASKLTSGVNGRKYRRPAGFSGAARGASVSEEINIASIDDGKALVGVAISDANGNPDEHDESVNPGLDDARFATLRTHEGEQGVYVNRHRVFSSEGSDFYLKPHRRVLNIGHEALRRYFIRRLSKPVLVDKKTGFILESEAIEIEDGARKAMSSALMAKPMASGVQFTLSRTDNLLPRNAVMNGDGRVLPLAYPEFINLESGFINPALLVVTPV